MICVSQIPVPLSRIRYQANHLPRQVPPPFLPQTHFFGPVRNLYRASQLPHFIKKGIGRPRQCPGKPHVPLHPTSFSKKPIGVRKTPHRDYSLIIKNEITFDAARFQSSSSRHHLKSRSRRI